MNIKQLKRELNINNQDIAYMFGMTYGSYANSTAKQRYEAALCRFYSLIKKRGEKIKEKNQTDNNQTNEPETSH